MTGGGRETRRPDVDVAVVGAGVVGLACAAALARRGERLLVLERGDAPGQGTTSRNSGVVHAGLYYPPGSLKARCCVEGRRLLYARCEAEGIPHRRTGKLVVATDDAEAEALVALERRATDNGVEGLELWDAATVRRREPTLRAVAALWSPASGIVDPHELAASYLREARAHGADLALRTEVVALDPVPAGWRVGVREPGGEPFAVTARRVVNAAGLTADRVAALAGLDVDALGWRLHFNKGDWFTVAPSVPRPSIPLVYPIPAEAGLGVHLTEDLGGACLAGPDTTWVDAPRYDVDAAKAGAFAAAVRRYLPGVEARHLAPAMAGVRPKLQRPDGPPRDFVLADGSAHGAPGTVHLVGIESPGLTAAGALAARVAALPG